MAPASIGALLGIEQVESSFGDEIDRARRAEDRDVLSALFEMACSGKCPPATIFWCKTRLGMKETSVDSLSRPASQDAATLAALERVYGSSSSPSLELAVN